MASILLKRLIGKETDENSLKAWLRDLSTEPLSFDSPDADVQVTQGEFAAFLADYLRSQTSSFIGSKKCCQLKNLLKNECKSEFANDYAGAVKPTKASNYKKNPNPEQKSELVLLQFKLPSRSSKYGLNFSDLGPSKFKSGKNKKHSIGVSSLEKSCSDNPKLIHDPLLLSPEQKSKDLSQPQLSPYSPEYSANFPELGSNKSRLSNSHKRHSADSSIEEINKNLDLLLLEESVPRKASGRRNKRRIKSSLLDSPSCSPNEDSEILGSSATVLHDKEILKTERLKMVSSGKKYNANPSHTSAEDIFDRESIHVLSRIYSFILRFGLLPNIIGELKFLLHLLLSEPCTCSEYGPRNNNKMNYDGDENIPVFKNENECILFAAEVIKSEFELLWCLDNYALNLIASNARIASVSEELCLMIAAYISARVSSTSNHTLPTLTCSHFKTVTFQYETDKRSNFISEKSFRVFCKQRDLFYEIYQFKNYKGNNTMEPAVLNKNINHLVNLSQDPVNLSHLASLVIDQCISSVINQEFCGEKVEPIFPDLDINKWMQLNKRLVQPLSEVPVDTQEEHFFKSFIYAVNNNRLFITIIIQTILNKIYDLTNEITSLFDIGDIEPVEMSSKLLLTHHSLILLGRLLGISLYEHNRFFPQTVIKEKLSSIWSLTSPSVDFPSLLEKSINKGILVLTIPWMIECLLFIDPVSLNVVQNKTFIQSLISFYMATSVDNLSDHWNEMPSRLRDFDSKIRHINFTLTKVRCCAFNESEKLNLKIHNVQLTDCTSMFLRLWISRLFMDSSFYSALFKELFYNQFSSVIYCNEDVYIQGNRSSLDSGNVINQGVLNKYIPDINQLMSTFNWKMCNNSTTVRHITPKKINHPHSSGLKPSVEVQMKLEESFFGLHKGLKSTLDFIVERLANVCKSSVNNNIIEAEKKKILKCMKSLKQLYSRARFKHELFEMASKAIKQMRVDINTMVSEHCDTRIPSAISSLLSSDNEASFLPTCQKIAARKFKQQMITWANVNIPVEEVLVAELNERNKKNNPPIETQSFRRAAQYMYDDKNTWSKKLIRFQEVMEYIVLKKVPTPTYNRIIKVFYDICENIEYFNLRHKVLRMIYTATWDMVITLLANVPNMVTDDLLEYVTNFWKSHHYGTVERRMLCPRNIYIVSKCGELTTVGVVYAKLIALLVNKGLLTLMKVEKQALSLLRHTWEQKELQFIKNSMYHTKQLLKDSPYYDDAKFSLMFEWITETTAEIESEYD